MEPSGAIRKQSVKQYGARWCYNMEPVNIEIRAYLTAATIESQPMS